MAKVSQFHLAFPVTDLDKAREFYGGVMGCPEGRSSAVYVDFDFYGHQIVAHIARDARPQSESVFDGHTVPVPHFGLNLDGEAWLELATRLKKHNVTFAEEPHQRLSGLPGQHMTMFLFDPFGNALEFKSFDDQSEAFLGGFQAAKSGLPMPTAAGVAVLGTGIMGMAMAHNLRKAGFSVTVWNRTRERAQPFAEAGGAVAETPAEAAGRAEVVITMLSDGPAVESAMAGEAGALAAMRPGSLWAQMSTVGVAPTERLWGLARGRGVDFVDAPVLGTRQPAEQGKLVILASGAEALRPRCEAVFAAVGERTLWVGDVGASSRLKLVANQWSTGMVALLAETVTLARALDLDPKAFFDLVRNTPFSAPYAQMKGEHMMSGRFPPSFPLDMAHKDVRLVLEAAGAAGRRLPVTSAIERQYDAAEARGRGREDLSAIIAALELNTGA